MPLKSYRYYPQRKRQGRNRSMIITKKSSSYSSFFTCCCLLLALLQYSTTITDTILPTTLAKEIEATHEWTLLGENDTVAAGMHIKMDLSTGEKWVKLISDEHEDNDDDNEDGQREKDGNKHNKLASAQVTADGLVVAQQLQEGDDVATTSSITTTDQEEEEPQYDFDMMHRTLSHLPPDEQERIGGIPELPDATTTKVTPEQRQLFETKMKEIWEQRQAELKEFSEQHLANLPQLLKDRIQSIQEYLQNPKAALDELNLEQKHDNNDDDDDKNTRISDLLDVLQDLEYHLTDVDMTRDFYTLGGWPLLTSLLADSVHETYQNDTQSLLSQADWNKINVLQAHAAWAIGTAVKNTGEFFPYAVAEVEVLQQQETIQTTPLDLILAQFIASSQAVFSSSSSSSSQHNVDDKTENYDSVMLKVHKTLYALGSLLRGNRMSQNHFCADQGPALLAQVLEHLAKQQGNNDNSIHRDTIKVVSKLLSLSHDIVVDVTLHPSQSPQVDEAIQKAFSSPLWCTSVVQFTQVPRLYETSLHTIQHLAPHCKNSWDLEQVQQDIQQIAAQSSSTWLSDDLDPDIRKERNDLLDDTVQAIQSASKQ